MYSYAIIGFGGLGKSHLLSMETIAKQRGDLYLKAICGTTKESFNQSVQLNIGNIDMSQVNIDNCAFYDNYKELIVKEEPDFIIITLPTYLHAEVSIFALERGVSVFCEKPMALTIDECQKMIYTAEKHNAKLAIGHCQRFETVFEMVKDFVDNNTYGKCFRARFTRFTATPIWTWNNWILNPELSGGSPLDLHIHDADLINWFFGYPKTIHSAMTSHKLEMESISTQYVYDDGLTIVASADWSMNSTFPFNMRCIINFEKATIMYENEKMTIYTDDEAIVPDLGEKNCYVKELEAFTKYVIDGKYDERLSTKLVKSSVNLVMQEVESAKTGETIVL